MQSSHSLRDTVLEGLDNAWEPLLPRLAGITEDEADRLQLQPMVERNTESMTTAFTASVDLIEGVSTGISAADRAATIRALADPSSQPAATWSAWC